MRPALEVADIFRRHGDAFRATQGDRLSRDQRRVMAAIEACRTATLGGHVEQCDDCGMVRVAYNSCLMGNFRNGELATGPAANLAVFLMVRYRSACLLLSITMVARRDRPTGDRAPGRHKVFAACRCRSEAGNL